MCRHGRRRCGIQHVVFSRERKLECTPRLSFAQNGPNGLLRAEFHLGNSPVRGFLHAVTLDRSKGLGNTFAYVFALVISNDLRPPGHHVYQTLERRLYGVKIFVDVGMVELYRGKNDGLGKIMEKFWAFIEKRRVVLVTFDNEMFALP